jgi:ATP-dependent Lhr-like helicase
MRAKAMAESLLERHGVVTRGSVVSEGIRGGFALAYKVLSGFEETGRARRGYFVEGLGAAQFATSATVDRLRSFTVDAEAVKPRQAITLAATDPANPYGAALGWPHLDKAHLDKLDDRKGLDDRKALDDRKGLDDREGANDRPGSDKRGHRPGRKAGALVVIVDGELAVYVERGGKTVLTFTGDEDALRAAAASLVQAVRTGVGKMRVERVDGEFSIGTAFGDLLTAAGFSPTPQGLRLRA